MIKPVIARCRWPLLTLVLMAPMAAGYLGSAAAADSAARTDGAAAQSAPLACAAPDPGPRYLLASQADSVALLPPPPAADSTAQAEDLQAVLDAQRAARADGTIAHAIADATASCARFADVIGPQLTSKNDAGVVAFLDRAARDGDSIIGPAKDYWKRERPYAVSSQVERMADMVPNYKPPASAAGCADTTASAHVAANTGNDANDTRNSRRHDDAKRRQEAQAKQVKQAKQEQERAHVSYPSGHSAYGTVCAILLAGMVPEKRTQLFARARDFAHSRLVVGAHFPSDLEAGRIGGTVAAALLMQNAQFQRDYAAARAQLRASLGLPAQPPQPAPAAPAAVAPRAAVVPPAAGTR